MLLCFGCDFELNGDLKSSIETDTSSAYTFFSESPETNAGAERLTKNYKIGSMQQADAFPTFVREGYHIVGWHYYKNPTTMSTTVPTSFFFDDNGFVSSLTVTPQPAYLVAVWEEGNPGEARYTVTFVGRDGKTVLDTQQVLEGRYARKPSISTTDGDYIFVSWCIDPECTVVFDFAAKPISSDMTLYSKWAMARKISFCKNDGSGQVQTQTEAEGTTIALPENMFGERESEGYFFLGWSKSAAAERPDYKPHDDYTVGSEDASLYAVWTANSCTVTFINTNTAVSERLEKKVAKDTVTSLESLLGQTSFTSPTGYTLLGLSRNADATEADSSLSQPLTMSDDLTCYVLWGAWLEVHDNYADDGGTEKTSTTAICYGHQVEVPAEPQRGSPYVFTGWYTDSKATIPADFANLPAPDGNAQIHIYAGWYVPSYTVTFKKVDGTVLDVQTVEYGKTALQPKITPKEGYSLEGWYTDEACTQEFDLATPVTQDYTLYAKWTVASYSVTFVEADGSAVSGVAAQNVVHGTTATEPAAPEKTGSSFAGWYADSSWKTAFDFSTPITRVTVVYAKWNTATYTVSFVESDGSAVAGVAVQTVEYGKYAVQPEAPTKEGYLFGGWYTDTSFDYEFDFNTPITQDTFVYAKWREGRMYTVTFVGRDGKTALETQHIESGQTINWPSFSYDDGEYHCWGLYADAECTEWFDWGTRITQDTTIYTKWSIPFMATFYKNDGTDEKVQWALEKGSGQSIPQGNIFSARTDGYYFLGWATSPTATTPEYYPDDYYVAEKDYTLYALWSTDTCTVTIVNSYKPAETWEFKVAAHSKVSLGNLYDNEHPFTGPEHYSRIGYTASATATEPDVWEPVNIDSDATYYALWGGWFVCHEYIDESGNDYTYWMNFYYNNPTQIGDPWRGDQYAFDGWYLDSDYTTPVDFENRPEPDEGSNIHIYAKWKTAVYTVRFFNDDGSVIDGVSEQQVEYGNTASKPANPERDGFTFNGWYVDGVPYDFTEAITRDINVYAYWNQIAYSVKFVDTDGTVLDEQTVSHNETPGYPSEPQKEHFVFKGWYADSTYTTLFDFGAPVTKDTVIYAKWASVPTVTITIPSYSAIPVTATAGGTEISETVKTVDAGTNVVFTVGDGWTVQSWLFDGSAAASSGTKGAVSTNGGKTLTVYTGTLAKGTYDLMLAAKKADGTVSSYFVQVKVR